MSKDAIKNFQKAYSSIENGTASGKKAKPLYKDRQPQGGMDASAALKVYDEMFSPSAGKKVITEKKQNIIEQKANDVPKVITKEDKMKMIGALSFIKEALEGDINSDTVIKKIGMVKDIISEF